MGIRCRECGESFFPASPEITICQNCSQEGLPTRSPAPEPAQKVEKPPQSVNLRDLAAATDQESTQSVDLKALVEKAPTKQRRTRKPKVTVDEQSPE